MQRAIDYIRAGDVFQVNLSQRLTAQWGGDPFALYARLRAESPAPFAALVRLGGADVISASPERFLSRRGDSIETRPIKGTRPRAADAAADRRLALALRSSAKDVAENVMIVDLARNDLGRVARFGTVSVEELCALESHPGVHHLVSTVAARPRPDVSAADVIRATFPPGSVTGAPKVRALEIIEELEPVRRGPYCGAVGWFGPGDELELSVAIRTMIAARDALHLHVGGAVTADSDPAGEWQETMHKAARLLRPPAARSRPAARRSRSLREDLAERRARRRGRGVRLARGPRLPGRRRRVRDPALVRRPAVRARRASGAAGGWLPDDGHRVAGARRAHRRHTRWSRQTA